MKQLTYLIGALILGLSIVISALILNNSSLNSANQVNSSQLMTKTQLAEYLQMSEESIKNIIKEDDLKKDKLNSYEKYRFIPYLKLDNQERFIKSEIDKWLKYKNDQH